MGRDFLSEQSPLPPEEPKNRALGRRRLSIDRGALARGESVLSLASVQRYSVAEAGGCAGCRQALPMLGRGACRALLPAVLSVALRKQPSGFARRSSISEVLCRRMSPALPKPSGLYTASSLAHEFTGLGVNKTRSGDVLRRERGLYRIETILSLYDFVPKVRVIEYDPRENKSWSKGLWNKRVYWAINIYQLGNGPRLGAHFVNYQQQS